MDTGCLNKKFIMEFFNFENKFEIEVNHPQVEVFTKLEAYVSKKTWKIIHSDHKEFISFQTRTALIAITFIANNDNSTTLSITTKTEQFDYNKSVGAIHKILKECFSEQIDNVEEEHKEVQSSNSKPKQKKKRSNSKPKYSKKQTVYNTNDNISDFSRYINWQNIAIAIVAFFFVIPNIFNSIEDSENDIEKYYSYYDAVGNKVVVNLNEDGSGTIKMIYAKTSSGLEEYMSKEPIPCSWDNYTSLGYLAIYSRQGNIYIKDGWAYFDTLDMEAKDKKRGCKLN